MTLEKERPRSTSQRILEVLVEGPSYGYKIAGAILAQDVSSEQKFLRRQRVRDNVYHSLGRLVRAGLVEQLSVSSETRQKTKTLQLTDQGREIIEKTKRPS